MESKEGGAFNKSEDIVCLVNNVGMRLEVWSHFPTGMAQLAAVLKEEGYKIRVLDLDVYPELESEISNYKIILFTLIAAPILSFTLKKIEEVKKQEDKIVIVGGPLVTAMPNEVLKETKADYFIYGDVEISLVELLEYLEGKKFELEKIAGLGYRNKHEIKINPPNMIKDLDILPMPDLESFDTEKYIIHTKRDQLGGKRTINWHSSRGCNFDCQFCAHLKNWRGYSPKRMVEDLKYLKESYGIDSVWFFDDNFMTSTKRVAEFCELVKPLNMTWGCEGRVTSINEDIIRKMKDAGCRAIRSGFESGSDRMLKVMRKVATVEDAKKAVNVLTKLDMPVKGGFIFGSPTETLEDAKMSLKLIKWIYKTNPRADIWTVYFSPRPDTPWYDLAVQKGMKEVKLHEWADKYKHRQLYEFNMSELSEKQIKSIMRKVRIYKFLSLSKQRKYRNVPLSLTKYAIRNVNSFVKSLIKEKYVQYS